MSHDAEVDSLTKNFYKCSSRLHFSILFKKKNFSIILLVHQNFHILLCVVVQINVVSLPPPQKKIPVQIKYSIRIEWFEIIFKSLQ